MKSIPVYTWKAEGCVALTDKSGTGWWDSDREGIDEDEVGAKEIWEGMGSATLGGLEWH